jgi:hypothetical protein
MPVLHQPDSLKNLDETDSYHAQIALDVNNLLSTRSALANNKIVFLPLLCSAHWTFLKLFNNDDGKVTAHYFDAKSNDANDQHVIQLAAICADIAPEQLAFVNVTKPTLSLLYQAAQKLYPTDLNTETSAKRIQYDNDDVFFTSLYNALSPENQLALDYEPIIARICLEEQLRNAVALQPSDNNTICGLLAELALKTQADNLEDLLNDACYVIANHDSRLAWVTKEYNKFYEYKFKDVEYDAEKVDIYLAKQDLSTTELCYLLDTRYQRAIEPFMAIEQEKEEVRKIIAQTNQQLEQSQQQPFFMRQINLQHIFMRQINLQHNTQAMLPKFELSETDIEEIASLNYLSDPNSPLDEEVSQILQQQTIDKILAKYYDSLHQQLLNEQPNLSEPEIKQQLHSAHHDNKETIINFLLDSSLLKQPAKLLLIAELEKIDNLWQQETTDNQAISPIIKL